MIDGIANFNWWQLILFTLAITHVSIASVTIYLHRCQAHRALGLHPIMSHFFRFWLWLTTGTVTREWVAVHRYHHARCETEEDPHSPVINGIKKVLWQGYELYRASADKPELIERYSHGTPDDWLEHYIYRYKVVGIGLMLAIDVVLFGVLVVISSSPLLVLIETRIQV